MSTEESVSQWIQEVKRGHSQSAAAIWERYFPQIVQVARQRLKGQSTAVADEEDVALSVLDSFFQAANQGRLPDLNDRDGLIRVLSEMTRRKAVDYIRSNQRLKRGGGLVQVESRRDQAERSLAGLEQLASGDPTPQFAAILLEESQRLLDQLDEELQFSGGPKDGGIYQPGNRRRARLLCSNGRATIAADSAQVGAGSRKVKESHDFIHQSISDDEEDRVEQVCEDFESAWRAGRDPDIESFLGETSGCERAYLLYCLLQLEIEYKRSGGRAADCSEYEKRFPEFPSVSPSPPSKTWMTMTAKPGWKSPIRTRRSLTTGRSETIPARIRPPRRFSMRPAAEQSDEPVDDSATPAGGLRQFPAAKRKSCLSLWTGTRSLDCWDEVGSVKSTRLLIRNWIAWWPLKCLAAGSSIRKMNENAFVARHAALRGCVIRASCGSTTLAKKIVFPSLSVISLKASRSPNEWRTSGLGSANAPS